MKRWVLVQRSGHAWVRFDLSCMTAMLKEAAQFDSRDAAQGEAVRQNRPRRIPVFPVEVEVEGPPRSHGKMF